MSIWRLTHLLGRDSAALPYQLKFNWSVSPLIQACFMLAFKGTPTCRLAVFTGAQSVTPFVLLLFAVPPANVCGFPLTAAAAAVWAIDGTDHLHRAHGVQGEYALLPCAVGGGILPLQASWTPKLVESCSPPPHNHVPTCSRGCRPPTLASSIEIFRDHLDGGYSRACLVLWIPK